MAIGLGKGGHSKQRELPVQDQLGISLINSMLSHCLGTEAHATQLLGDSKCSIRVGQ